MPPKGHKRSRVSAVSFVDELRKEVDSSLEAGDALVGAFRSMCSTKLTLDRKRNLPPKVIWAHLSCKYEPQLLSAISFSMEDLRVLPKTVRWETIAKLTSVSLEEAPIIFEGLGIVKNHGVCGVTLLSPPTATCLACSRNLALHNKACDVVVHTLSGKRNGLKLSLRCEHCHTNYNYDRYGDKTKGWSLYPESRPFVEASDVCFVDRKLLDFQCALA